MRERLGVRVKELCVPWEGRKGQVAALVAAMLVAAGCGSTRSDRELAASQPSRIVSSSTGPGPTSSVDPSASGQPASPAQDPSAGGANGQAPTAAGASGTPNPAAGAKSPAAPAVPAGGGSAEDSAGPGGSGAQPTGTGGSGAPAPAAGPVTGPRSDIVLGVLGTLTGIVGEAVIPTSHAARAWAADVNARGGLDGHPVRLVSGDDGGDPARALAVARRMVDQDHVAAFYAQFMPLTIQAVLPFLEERKIPVIGGCNCSYLGVGSPMNFEVGTGADLGITTAQVGPLLAFSDKRKVSVLYCREAAICDHVRRVIRDQLAPKFGLEVVHEAQTSLAQPDFTGEVLAARNAGAEAIVVAMDNASVIRINRTAKRQGWSPLITVQWSTQDERFLKDGGSDAEGVLVGSPLPHWDSPKMADYRTALSRYVPGAVKAGVGLPAWAAGKLLERIAVSLPPDGAITHAEILRALYLVKGETLGGLIPPVTYQEGQPTPENLCFIPLRVENGRYQPKDGDNYYCPHEGRG